MIRLAIWSLVMLSYGHDSFGQKNFDVSSWDTSYVVLHNGEPRLRDSLPDGIWSLYNDHGNCFLGGLFHSKILLERGSYINAKRQGTFTYYNPNQKGQILRIENYSNGILDGEFNLYVNGTLQTEGFYRMGRRSGLWKSYDECWVRDASGQAIDLKGYYLVSETMYENGQIIFSTRYECNMSGE